MLLKHEKDASGVPFLQVSGKPEEMGLIHGELFAPLIRNLYLERLDILMGARNGLTSKDIQSVAMELWISVCKFDSQIAVEVEATALAAGLHPWQMVVAGGYTDLMDILTPITKGNYHECTIAIDPVAGFIAGTWDSHPSAMDALIVLQRHPTIGHSTLALTTAGWPCQQGVNSSGVGFAITNLTPRITDKLGLVYIAANAALGSANSVTEIENRLKNEKFCSGHSYIIVDANGRGSVLETTPESVRVTTVMGMSIKANHYWGGADAIDDNSSYSFLNCSIERESELAINISGVTNSIEFANCLINSPSVNRKDSKGPSITCAHFFISAKDKSLWYSRGPAVPSLGQNPMLSRQLSNEIPQ